MTIETKAESFTYEASTSWAQLPPGMTLHECPGVSVAADGTVYLMTRNTAA